MQRHGIAYNLSRKEENFVVPPVRPMLAQKRPCNSSGNNEILYAIVWLSPAWVRPDEDMHQTRIYCFYGCISATYRYRLVERGFPEL